MIGMRKAEVKSVRVVRRWSDDRITFRSKRREAINDRPSLKAAETHFRVTAARKSGENGEANIRIDRNLGLKRFAIMQVIVSVRFVENGDDR